MKKLLTLLVAFMFTGFMYGQSSITGKIIDNDGDALIGASVYIDGTSSGTITDVDGKFMMKNINNGQLKLVVSYIGFKTKSIDVTVNGKTDMGTVALESDAVGLDAIIVTGVMDIVKDRRTPVAVSTIPTAEIQAKGGNVEFPELMKSTPSIFVANQSGGYGDSEVFTRGFDQTNTAFLLNGQPINGMEDGKMYWSNWSGMSDIATAIQVQRGLGSSKLAISSVGGTTNIIMRPTAQKAGGNVSFMYGNDNYMKATAMYNTGMINDKFGISVLLTHWQGDGWAEGTKGQGQNYFVSAGYKINKRNSLNFLITGAPQWHDQNYSKKISAYYNDPANPDDINLKFNNNYGELDGEYYSLRRNYYHKPVANLNWEFDINEKSSLSTVVYASWGRGGGSGDIGNRDNRFYTEDGHIDWDAVHAANVAENGNKEWVVRNSVNSHQWYGLVTTYDNKITDNLSFSIGADLRNYTGTHFRELRDLMGAPSYSQYPGARFDAREVTETFEADPWKALSGGAELKDRIAYANDETITYYGTFGQLEYNTNKFSAFLQGAVSNQSHVRFELMNETEENEKSETVTNLGYNVKTGASYSLNDNNTVFFNTGYYQRQPFHDNIFLNYSNFVNPVTVSEKIFGVEAGYKFFNENFAANLNVYRTSWKDRATTRTLDPGSELPDGTLTEGDAYRNTLQNQLHQGVELDFVYSATPKLRVKGFTSIGDWGYEGTLDSKYYNEDRELILESVGDDVDGVKVGGAAQTTFGIGLDYEIINGLRLDADYNYYSNFYSKLGVGTEALELPSFGLLDVGISYNHNLSNGQLLTFRANMYNALGEEYISRATSSYEADADDNNNWNGINKSNYVTFGKTRTWNVSVKYSF